VLEYEELVDWSEATEALICDAWQTRPNDRTPTSGMGEKSELRREQLRGRIDRARQGNKLSEIYGVVIESRRAYSAAEAPAQHSNRQFIIHRPALGSLHN
jgi:hypothetical protein